MIRPNALYNKARFSRDFASLGRVVAVLCGNTHIERESLADYELSCVEEIENENDQMEKNLESARQRSVARKRKERDNRAMAGAGQSGIVAPCHTLSHDVTPCHTLSRLVTHTNDTNDTTDTTDTNKKYINRTDPDTEGVLGGAADMRSASGSDRLIRVNVYSMGDEEMFSGRYDVLTLYRNACGDGFWAKARRKLGDAAMLEELSQFVHEVRAGETVENPGAVMSERLKARGV